MMPAIKKAFNFLGDDIVELSTENDALKKIGDYDEKWLQESKEKLLKRINDEETANLNMSRMKKKVEKTLHKWLINLIINCGRVNFLTSFLKVIGYKIWKLIN